MYIKTSASAYQPGGFKTPEMAEPVEFDSDGRARVTKDVGQFLADEFDHISIDAHEGETDDDTDDGGDDTPTDDESESDDASDADDSDTNDDT